MATPTSKELANKKDKDGRSLLLHTLLHNGQIEPHWWPLNPEDWTARDNTGWNVQGAAIFFRKLEGMDSLPKEIWNYADKNGEAALHQCAKFGTQSIGVAATLLEWGADPLKKNKDGKRPTALAIDKETKALLLRAEKEEISRRTNQALQRSGTKTLEELE